MMSGDRWPEVVEVIHAGHAHVMDKLRSLKVDGTLSTLELAGRAEEGVLVKVVESLADLLKSNRNIKRLISTGSNKQLHLLEALACGRAGDNLVSLKLGGLPLDSTEVSLLASYLDVNRNLRSLDVQVGADAAALQLMSALTDRQIDTHLEMYLTSNDTGEVIGEISTELEQCSSISSLELVFANVDGTFVANDPITGSIANMPFLTRFGVFLMGDAGTPILMPIIDAIESAMVKREGGLEHIAVGAPILCTNERSAETWQTLGMTLGSVKSVSLCFDPSAPFRNLLPHLQSCETLEVSSLSGWDFFATIGPIISKLRELRTLIVDNHLNDAGFRDTILDTIAASNSITRVVLKPEENAKKAHPSLQVEVEAFCLLNTDFFSAGTSIGSTDLWTRVLFKIQGVRPRATFLYRLLCENPDLIVGSVQSFAYSKVVGKP